MATRPESSPKSDVSMLSDFTQSDTTRTSADDNFDSNTSISSVSNKSTFLKPIYKKKFPSSWSRSSTSPGSSAGPSSLPQDQTYVPPSAHEPAPPGPYGRQSIVGSAKNKPFDERLIKKPGAYTYQPSFDSRNIDNAPAPGPGNSWYGQSQRVADVPRQYNDLPPDSSTRNNSYKPNLFQGPETYNRPAATNPPPLPPRNTAYHYNYQNEPSNFGTSRQPYQYFPPSYNPLNPPPTPQPRPYYDYSNASPEKVDRGTASASSTGYAVPYRPAQTSESFSARATGSTSATSPDAGSAGSYDVRYYPSAHSANMTSAPARE